MAKYTAEMEEHGVHGDAVYAADKSVRQAHGSSAITSKSQVARARSLSWFTGFFTFFNDLFNRQVETLWKAGEALDLAKEAKYGEAMKLSTEVSGRLFAYVIAPAIIEELVTPLSNDQHESWGKKAAKGLGFTLSSSYVFVREIANAMLNGRDPAAGLLTTSYKALTDMARDLTSVKPKPGNIIKHGATLAGMLTGVAPAQVGRTAEFMAGKEKPKGPWGWLVGARYGTLQNHSPTFDKWWKGK
jgi:phage anti-repressor protein